MTPPGHLLTGYLVAAWAAGGRRKDGRTWIMAAALAGSMAPDFDVVFGLLGGWTGASIHRGVMHSFVFAAGFAAVAAVLARRHRQAVFGASFAAGATHVLWDSLNFWGVQALWPWTRYFRANLIHERDLAALAIVALAAVAVWKQSERLALLWLLAALPAHAGVQLWWRDRAQRIAAEELPGRRVGVYPTGSLQCGWLIVSAGPSELTSHCLATPVGRLELVRTVPVVDDAITRATTKSPAVREFFEKSPFPFAEEKESGALVIWRDLRDPRGGLHVRLDSSGKIVSERHEWPLNLW